jgi:hypothetical protein
LPYKISKIIGEHTCEGKSKDKSIGWADNLQQYYGCFVNLPLSLDYLKSEGLYSLREGWIALHYPK